MERVIYCPEESFLSEAGVLSEQLRLPILIGDNFYTKNLLFDRKIVQKLLIPKENYINIFYPTIKKNFHQIIEVKNEFFILKNNIELFINDLKIKSLYEEKYYVKYLFIANKVGINKIKIFINEKEEYSGEFEVI